MGLGGSGIAIGEDIARAHAAVEAALDAGINCFDHADIYAEGLAESAFGRVLAMKPSLRDRVYLQSKCGIRMADRDAPKRYDLSRRWIMKSVDGSLSRLGTDYLDVLLLHRPDPLMEPDEIASAFSSLRRSGKVRHFGVSNMHQHQIALLSDALEDEIVVNQLPLGLAAMASVDEGIRAGDPAGPGPATPGLLDWCRRRGIQLQAWGPLGRGLFSGANLAKRGASAHAVTRRVAEAAERLGRPPEAIVVAWLLRHPAGIQPVIGTTRPERIHACAEALAFELDRETWYALFEAARGAPVP